MTTRAFNWREFLLLSTAGVVGVIALIPYALTLQAPRLREAPLPLELLIPIQVVQNAILIAIGVGVGLLLAKRTGLGAPVVEGWLAGERIRERFQAMIAPSMISGLIVALILIALDKLVFASRVPQLLSQVPQIPIWQGFLASFYGGITEELLMRLGLFSLLAWLLGKLSHTAQGFPTGRALWTANILVAAIFGLGHLPATAALVPLTTPVVVRAFALNGLAALVFGHLYWRRGLESAMLAHFTADIVLHVITPAFRI